MCVWPCDIHVQSDIDRASYDEHQEVCSAAAKDARNGIKSPYIPNSTGTVEGAMATGAASGFAKGIAKSQAFFATYNACMEEHGYRKVVVSDAEHQKIRDIEDKDERASYIFNLVTSGMKGSPTPEEHKENKSDKSQNE
jgi:hypothetical protein